MILKTLGPISLLACLATSAYGVNTKLLDVEAEHHANRILIKAPDLKEGLEATLKRSYVEDDEAFESKDKLSSQFAGLLQKTEPFKDQGSFRTFVSLCQDFFISFEGQTKQQIVLYELLKRVTQKVSDTVRVLTFLQTLNSRDDSEQQGSSETFTDAFRPDAFKDLKAH